MSVQDFMHTTVTTVTPDTLVRTAYQVMRDTRIRHLPVVTDEGTVATVTLRFLTRRTLEVTLLPPDPAGVEAVAEERPAGHRADFVAGGDGAFVKWQGASLRARRVRASKDGAFGETPPTIAVRAILAS